MILTCKGCNTWQIVLYADQGALVNLEYVNCPRCKRDISPTLRESLQKLGDLELETARARERAEELARKEQWIVGGRTGDHIVRYDELKQTLDELAQRIAEKRS